MYLTPRTDNFYEASPVLCDKNSFQCEMKEHTDSENCWAPLHWWSLEK